MRAVPHSRYYLTETRGGKVRRYASGWAMSPDEAAARGCTEADIVPGTTLLREMPETEEEMRRAQFDYQSAGIGGARGPKGR